MSNAKKVAFNHKAEDIRVACGLQDSDLDKRYEKLMIAANEDRDAQVSNMVENLENEFTPRELSYILTMKLHDEARRSATNPLEELMKAIGAGDNSGE